MMCVCPCNLVFTTFFRLAGCESFMDHDFSACQTCGQHYDEDVPLYTRAELIQHCEEFLRVNPTRGLAHKLLLEFLRQGERDLGELTYSMLNERFVYYSSDESLPTDPDKNVGMDCEK